MDWASDDYSRIYADTFLVPAPESGAGIQLFDEGERPEDHYDGGCACRCCAREAPVGARCCAREPFTPARARSYSQKENYYGGSSGDRDIKRAIFGAAWDERPTRYAPRAGSGQARLIPPPQRAAPAFPLDAQPEVRSGGFRLPPPSKECFSGGGIELRLQYMKVFLLIIIVVLMAMSLLAAGRLMRSLERNIKTAVEALNAAASRGGTEAATAAE
jgi:hypothetical protein